ncbi:MAG TPA: hypothetical protein PLD54_01275 [Candidatus Levybacteria bacterium]|nr:hypothetical protein [Candidatus Levybacteria bacterium]
MDTPKEIRQDLHIPVENVDPYAVQDAAQFENPDISDQLKDAGVHDPEHFATISDHLNEVHGNTENEITENGVYQKTVHHHNVDPHSVAQIENSTQPVDTPPGTITDILHSNPSEKEVFMPIRYLLKRASSGLKSFITKPFGSSSSSEFNGHIGVDELTKQNIIPEPTATKQQESVENIQPANQENTQERSPQNISHIEEFQKRKRKEVPHAA